MDMIGKIRRLQSRGKKSERESAGALDMGSAQDRVDKGQGVLGRAFASGVPLVSLQAAAEPAGVGSAAPAVGLDTVVALPVLHEGQVGHVRHVRHVVAVVAWYF